MSNDPDIDALAAEYALGSLPAAERLAVTQRLGDDQGLARAVADWQGRLAPLSLHEPGAAPPPQSLERVLARIAHEAIAGQGTERVVILRRAKTWRWATASLAAASIALAIALGTLVATQPRTTGALVAVLAKGDNSAADEPTGSTAPVFLVTIDTDAAVLTVRQTAGRRPAAERSYALWLDASGGASMTFIGLLSKADTTSSFRLPPTASRDWVGVALTISLEGGVIGPAPAGAILSQGKIYPAAR